MRVQLTSLLLISPELCVTTALLLKCCFTSTETVGLLGTGAQDVQLDLHTPPELCVTAASEQPLLYGV